MISIGTRRCLTTSFKFEKCNLWTGCPVLFVTKKALSYNHSESISSTTLTDSKFWGKCYFWGVGTPNYWLDHRRWKKWHFMGMQLTADILVCARVWSWWKYNKKDILYTSFPLSQDTPTPTNVLFILNWNFYLFSHCKYTQIVSQLKWITSSKL